MIEDETYISDENWMVEESYRLVHDRAHETVRELNMGMALVKVAPDPIYVSGKVKSRVADSQSLKTDHVMKAIHGRFVLEFGPPSAVSNSGRSYAMRASALSKTHPDFAKAISIFSQCDDDVRELWITYEFVLKRFGKPGLKAARLMTVDEIKSFGETANKLHRHAQKGGEAQLDHPEMLPLDMRRVLRTTLRYWVETDAPP
jgi:hypothetical protein